MSVRLFVALDLPPEVRDGLARWAAAVADPSAWRCVAPASLHVTLAFLGHRPEEDVATATAALAALAPRPVEDLALGGALGLPPRWPRVLAAAVSDGSGTLGRLQAAVAAALAEAGVYEPEARAFRPHVTVARLRSGARAGRAALAPPEDTAFTGGPVVLYRSRLGRGGAAYEALWPG